MNFEREYGCTEAEWLRWLPGAVRDCPFVSSDRHARIDLAGGQLQLHWTVLPPRQIALIRLPRMTVRFSFSGVGDGARADFMRYFDLYLQRGGG